MQVKFNKSGSIVIEGVLSKRDVKMVAGYGHQFGNDGTLTLAFSNGVIQLPPAVDLETLKNLGEALPAILEALK